MMKPGVDITIRPAMSQNLPGYGLNMWNKPHFFPGPVFHGPPPPPMFHGPPTPMFFDGPPMHPPMLRGPPMGGNFPPMHMKPLGGDPHHMKEGSHHQHHKNMNGGRQQHQHHKNMNEGGDINRGEEGTDMNGNMAGAGAPGPMNNNNNNMICLLYTSPSPRDLSTSRMPSSA